MNGENLYEKLDMLYNNELKIKESIADIKLKIYFKILLNKVTAQNNCGKLKIEKLSNLLFENQQILSNNNNLHTQEINYLKNKINQLENQKSQMSEGFNIYSKMTEKQIKEDKVNCIIKNNYNTIKKLIN